MSKSVKVFSKFREYINRVHTVGIFGRKLQRYDRWRDRLGTMVSDKLRIMYMVPVDKEVGISASKISSTISTVDPTGSNLPKHVRVVINQYRVAIDESPVNVNRCIAAGDVGLPGHLSISEASISREASGCEETIRRVDFYYLPSRFARVYRHGRPQNVAIPNSDFCMKVSFCVDVICDSNYCKKDKLSEELTKAAIESVTDEVALRLPRGVKVVIPICPSSQHLNGMILEDLQPSSSAIFTVMIMRRYLDGGIQFNVGGADSLIHSDHVIDALCISDAAPDGTIIDIGLPL